MAYLFHGTTDAGHGGHEVITLVVGVLLWGVGLVAIALSALALTGRIRTSVVGLAAYAPAMAAAFSAGSAAIHFTVIGDHFAEAPLEGVFFAAVAWGQLGWAMLALRRWDREVLLVGLVGNLGVALVWLWSRTLGLPFAPGGAEAMGGLDLLATLLELAVAVLAAIAIAARSRPGLTQRLAMSFSSAVLLSWTALLTVALVTSAAIAMGGHHEA